MIRTIAWAAFQVVDRLHLYEFIAWYYARQIKELGIDGTLGRPSGITNSGKPTLLILSRESFRGDPECLAKSGKVRVLDLPERWVTRLMYQFYPKDVTTSDRREFMNPEPSGLNWACKQRYRDFLRAFLPRFYKRVGVDCVIGHLVYHAAEVDWGAVSGKLGFPYIVLQRESMLITERTQNTVRTRLEVLGKFEGQQIVVHNTATKEVLISSKFVGPERVSILGCLRMDDFLSRIAAPQTHPERRKKVVFFTFTTAFASNEQWDPVFSAIHIAFANMAIRHPEIDLVIKSKPKFFKSWRIELMQAFDEAGIRPENIPNMEVTADGDAQDLILESDVICGLNSITTLEAAIAGKPVVLPCIGLFDPVFEGDIYYREYFHLFDVATTARELEDRVMQKLADPEVSNEVMAGRRALFEKYVSNIGVNATDSCVELIKSAITRPAVPANAVSRLHQTRPTIAGAAD